MFDRKEIENIILGMAEIVRENRWLRCEIKELNEYKEKYHSLLDEQVKHANESSAMLLKACLAGAFNVGDNAE